MKTRSFWKIAAPIACVFVICGAAIIWQLYRAKANERKLAEAARTCLVRAEQGDAKAESDLGNMYLHGQGVAQDYSVAIHWFRSGADQGDAVSADGLGYMYYYGDGVAQDYAESLRWYRKAADQGYAKAQNGLALLYTQGQGVPQDYTEALSWFRKAADQGYASAQYNLGNMYYYGRGLPQDRVEADRWYHKAADQGNENAQRALGLRGTGLGSWGIISLSAMFLVFLWHFKSSLLPRQRLQNRQQRTLILAELFGLAYVGLSLYGAFGIFQSLLAVNAFNFSKNLLGGITVAILISAFGPKSARVVMGISSILFVAVALLVIAHHDLTRLATTNLAVCSVSGLLLGMAVPLAVFLWLEAIKGAGDRQTAG